MSDSIRRIYNNLERFFDRHVISDQINISKTDELDIKQKTALAAYDCIKPLLLRYDKQASLKMIVSQTGIDTNGTSNHWEFFWDLPNQRAKVVSDWQLVWDDDKDSFRASKIQITINPFPPGDSPVRKLVADGKMLYRQMIGMWIQEYRRTPKLPGKFIDTDKIISDFISKGLRIEETEFSLSTGVSSDGLLSWIAHSREGIYFTTFNK